MREIIHLQVGQCGNRIGSKYWETLIAEHGINEKGFYHASAVKNVLERDNVYFREMNGHHVPRAVLVDLEPDSLVRTRSCAVGQLFRPDNYMFGTNGAGNNWAKGFYTEGAEILDDIMEVIRRETESCDCFEGFQVCHSLGGGTGSGLGTLIGQRIKDLYPDRMLMNFSVFPSAEVSEAVVEPYNATLSITKLLEHSDEVICFDNKSLYHICNKTMKTKTPHYKDLNYFISVAMSGVTTSLRFPCNLNYSLRKFALNMNPFPRLHFIMPGFSPMSSEKGDELTSSELTQQLFHEENMLMSCNPADGRYLSASALFRGQVLMVEVDKEIAKIQDERRNNFPAWIPDNLLTDYFKVPLGNLNKAATVACNNTAIQKIFTCVCDQFTAMFRRKAFLHWYQGEGMDELEFTNAHNDIKDLVSEYQQYQK
ncbi:tubulin beta chain-like [Styela clava]